jgi:TonB family protein
MPFDSTMVSLLAGVSVRAAVLAALAWVVLFVCRVRRADLRHAAWSLVLAAMLLTPLVVWLAPPLTLRVGRPSAALDETLSRETPLVVSATPLGSPARMPASEWARRNWQSILVALYAAGVLAMLGRLCYGYALARRLGRSSKAIQKPLATRIPVSESDCITVPVTIGWIRPRILLPRDWREWSDGKLRAVLAHESTHVGRGDYLVSVLASLNRALYWFHPLAWWLERALVTHAEQACDDETLSLTGDREQYAGALLDMAAAVRAGRGRLVWEAMAMARPSDVRRRIELALDESRRLAPGLSKARWAALALACAPLAYSAAAVHFAQAEAPQAQKTPTVILQGTYLQNLVAGNQLSPAQVEEIETRLRKEPGDLEARSKVIAYYFLKGIRQPRLDHIFWLIEHHPEAEVTRLYSMAISPRKTPFNDEADRERAQSLWREQVRRHAENRQVLGNAADYFASNGSDLELAIDLYKRCRRSDGLASLYSRILVATLRTRGGIADDPHKNPVLAERIRQELETTSDKLLFASVAGSLKNIAVPAGSYPAGAPHLLLREEHPELAPVFEYGDQLWKRAEDLGLVMKMPPPGARTLPRIQPVRPPATPAPAATTPPGDTETKPMRIRVGGNVQAAMLTKRVEPVYPPAAIEARLMGVVKLSVIISTEGTMQQIQVMNGHPLFVPAAMEAVKQWEYKPTLLNGKPAEVVTVVEVVFDLPASQ